MRINRKGGHISIGDQPGPFWALGLFLLAGGVIAIVMPLGLATNSGDLEPWERFASLAVGFGVSAGALWWLGRSPGTRVHLALTRRRLSLVRTGLSGRRVRQLGFDELQGAEVETTSDSDGGTVWRPAVRLRSGGSIPLSELWSHDERGVQEVVEIVAEACLVRR